MLGAYLLLFVQLASADVTMLVGAPLGSAPQALDPGVLSGRRVLVVDDNGTNRTILEAQLGGWGSGPTSSRVVSPRSAGCAGRWRRGVRTTPPCSTW